MARLKETYIFGDAGISGIFYMNNTTDATSRTTGSVVVDGGLGVAKSIYCNTINNAVSNDYAEYRTTLQSVKPGQVVVDNDDGSMKITTERLMPGAQVVSDTWGHIMGETENAKTPIAVAGRVLAYTFQDRSKYHAGMAVCSAPNGTVDIMTREEIKNYPDAIIGIVSEIPNYLSWGTENVLVDNRIWIKIR